MGRKIIFRTSRFTQVFQYVETAPVLSIVEGFLQEVDSLFLEHEQDLLHVSPESRERRGVGDEGGGEERDGGQEALEREGEDKNVDDEYVQALEVYCLVRQCLLDVRHSWRNVVSVVFKEHGKYAGLLNGYLSVYSKEAIKRRRLLNEGTSYDI